jgi:hypothetical protein
MEQKTVEFEEVMAGNDATVGKSDSVKKRNKRTRRKPKAAREAAGSTKDTSNTDRTQKMPKKSTRRQKKTDQGNPIKGSLSAQSHQDQNAHPGSSSKTEQHEIGPLEFYELNVGAGNSSGYTPVDIFQNCEISIQQAKKRIRNRVEARSTSNQQAESDNNVISPKLQTHQGMDYSETPANLSGDEYSNGFPTYSGYLNGHATGKSKKRSSKMNHPSLVEPVDANTEHTTASQSYKDSFDVDTGNTAKGQFEKKRDKKKDKTANKLTKEEIENGITSGDILIGTLRINSKNPAQAYVRFEGSEEDFFIPSKQHRNKALDGDIVYVKKMVGKQLEDATNAEIGRRKLLHFENQQRQLKCNINKEESVAFEGL